MNPKSLCHAFLICGLVCLGISFAGLLVCADPPANVPTSIEEMAGRIEPLSEDTLVRRRLAQATFCLPQNVLGTLLYGLLQLMGTV